MSSIRNSFNTPTQKDIKAKYDRDDWQGIINDTANTNEAWALRYRGDAKRKLGDRDEISEGRSSKLAELVKWFWDQKPAKRPKSTSAAIASGPVHIDLIRIKNQYKHR